MSKENKRWMIGLFIAVILLAVTPLMIVKDGTFGGSDDAGSAVIGELSAGHEPWFTPPLEQALGGELPGEVESLIFCIQTGIGVGILCFYLGRMVERGKWLEHHD